LAPTEPTAMKQYIRECIKLKSPYLYDPAFQIGNFSPDELREGILNAKILIGNDYEIALIEQKLGVNHTKLRAMVSILITTLGAKGSIIETPDKSMHIRRCDAENTLDPTGAGDAYRAGLLTGYLHGYDLETCGQMGSVAAAYTVEKYGTQTHSFTKKQFIQRYKKSFGKTVLL